MAILNEADKQSVDRLLAAVRDVAPPGHPKPLAIASAPESHRRAFEQYVAELRRAKAEADERWNGIVEGIIERTGKTPQEAQQAARDRNALGPSSHTRVVGTIRKHWQRCVELNASASPVERVPPEQFVLAWLVDENHVDLAQLVSGLTYWPIGLNMQEKDQWV
jgi:hypothetical protein